jgi:hypothetical protein
MGSTRGDYTGRNKQPLRLGSLIEHLWEEHLQRRHCFYSWIPHFCRIQCVKGEQEEQVIVHMVVGHRAVSRYILCPQFGIENELLRATTGYLTKKTMSYWR